MRAQVKFTDIVSVLQMAKGAADADFKDVYMYIDLNNNNKIWWSISKDYVPEGSVVIVVEPSFVPED
jgi:hypothetical protein